MKLRELKTVAAKACTASRTTYCEAWISEALNPSLETALNPSLEAALKVALFNLEVAL